MTFSKEKEKKVSGIGLLTGVVVQQLASRGSLPADALLFDDAASFAVEEDEGAMTARRIKWSTRALPMMPLYRTRTLLRACLEPLRRLRTST